MAKQTISFTPKARLIKILGEHLIKDATVGVLELVKNSYDADATSCEIKMISLNKTNATILIKDNGSGIDLATFLKKWMNPATGHKEEQKIRQKRSQLGRLPLGEKGVGRFAAQQIGNHLKLFSKSDMTQQELFVDIDWTKFEDSKTDLKDVTVDYKMQSPKYFIDPYETGTILEITDLKYPWNESDIKKISNALKRMKSPFRGANDFNVTLVFEDCPESFSLYENLELSDILDRAHYKLYGIVDATGVLEYEYECNLPGEKKIQRGGIYDLKNNDEVLSVSDNLSCGGFIINFYHYNKIIYAKSGNNKKDIEELSGVSVFRDGIRVLPYGEKGNDWLQLDNKRIQDPYFIGNDTIIGLVEIDQIENPKLIDKANREGLIENISYEHFEKLVFACVDFLNKERKSDRPKKEISAKQVKESIDNSLQDIKEKIARTATMSNDPLPSLEADTNLTDINESFENLKTQVDDAVEDLDKINKRLFHLAGTGLAAERFTHEFSKLVAGANDSLRRLVSQINISDPKIKKEVDAITGALEALRNDIKLLGPLFYIKKVAAEKELDICQVINNSVLLMENAMAKAEIKLEIIGDSFTALMREGSCMQIFVNLIDNSIFWLSRKSEKDDRKIKIIIDAGAKTVFVSDNGPGVVSKYRDRIFDPFFTMKSETGRGLGLYIIKEILEEKKWDIFLVYKDDYPELLKGASFKIVFNENVE